MTKMSTTTHSTHKHIPQTYTRRKKFTRKVPKSSDKNPNFMYFFVSFDFLLLFEYTSMYKLGTL